MKKFLHVQTVFSAAVPGFVDTESALEVGLVVVDADQELRLVHDLPLRVEKPDRAGFFHPCRIFSSIIFS